MPTKNPAVAAAVATTKKNDRKLKGLQLQASACILANIVYFQANHRLLQQQQLRVVPEASQMAAEAAAWRSL